MHKYKVRVSLEFDLTLRTSDSWTEPMRVLSMGLKQVVKGLPDIVQSIPYLEVDNYIPELSISDPKVTTKKWDGSDWHHPGPGHMDTSTAPAWAEDWIERYAELDPRTYPGGPDDAAADAFVGDLPWSNPLRDQVDAILRDDPRYKEMVTQWREKAGYDLEAEE